MTRFGYLSLIALSLCFGCLLELTEDSREPPQVLGCTSSVLCPGAARCTLGACITTTTQEDLYRIRILPSEGSGFEILDVVDVRLDNTGVQDLNTIRVPSPIKTSGSVRTQDGVNVEADIIAISGNTSGSRIRVETTTTRQGNISTFQMTLPTQSQTMSGTTRPLFFDLTVLPAPEQNIPPFSIDAIQSAMLSPPYFIDLPATSEIYRVQGRVLYDLTDRLPVHGMIAMLTNAEGRRLSTIETSGSDGRLEFSVWSQDVSAVSSMVLHSTVAHLPRIETPITLVPDEPLQTIEEQALNLGGQFVDWAGSVMGSEGLASTSIVAVAQLDAGRVAAVLSASDINGRFQMSLIPALYLFQITPPIDSPFGILRTQIDVKQGTTAILRPALKTRFPGILRDTDGRTISNATITAKLKSADFGDPILSDPKLAFGERVTRSRTDENGSFELRLEPGDYTFTIVPPVSTGLARFVQEVTCPRTPGSPIVFNFIAPLSHVLTLRLVDNADVPIGGELVQIWHQDSAQQVASARSNENGYVLLRLPARASAP